MKILVISLAGIGDTLMATPLIHELRAYFPNSILDALVLYPASGDLLAGNPHLNHVHQKNLVKLSAGEFLKYLLALRREKYDLSVNTHPQSRVHYRLVARAIGARLRVGHHYDHSGIFDRLLVNRAVPQDYTIHCLENNLALLPLCGAKTLLPRHDYELFLTAAEQDWAAQFAARPELAGRVLLGIHVGSGSTKNLALRRWPLDHYIALINQLNQTRPDIAILLFGGPDEEESHARILAATAPGKVLVPSTGTFRRAGALLQKCQVFLSVDTALMHLAAAMKVPRQIVIETPTFNKTVEPWGRPFITVKNPAVAGRNLDYYRYDGAGIRGTPEELLRIMASVTVDDVLGAVTG